ncbi:MAG: hypothetical protein GXO58_02260 [Thermodesulfobacteria bacterium]|nr:hypothetical protein [Thermodesulfobacteriota bacterium]
MHSLTCFSMRQLFLITTMLCTFFLAGNATGIAATADGSSDSECVRCHEKMVNRANMKRYIHKPFREKKCTICHLVGKDPSQEETQQPAAKRSKQKTKESIRWISRHFDPSRVHWFLIPASQVDDTLFLQVAGDQHKATRIQIPLPPISKLPVLKDDHQGPHIENVSFIGLQRGVFLSAIIQWHTDRPAGGQVLYGIQSPDENKTPFDPILTTEHRMRLSPVLPGKKYQYTVVSIDVFGNVSKSGPHFFSTDKTYILPRTDSDETTGGKPRIQYSLSSVNGNYFLHVIADQPTFMTIGVRRNLHKNAVITTKDATGKEKTFRHPPMKSRAEVSMTVCKSCHASYWEGATHPVGVRPRNGMRIPKEYPVLADGRITCMSCHQFHGSNYEARVIRPSKKALCIGCHKNYD